MLVVRGGCSGLWGLLIHCGVILEMVRPMSRPIKNIVDGGGVMLVVWLLVV